MIRILGRCVRRKCCLICQTEAWKCSLCLPERNVFFFLFCEFLINIYHLFHPLLCCSSDDGLLWKTSGFPFLDECFRQRCEWTICENKPENRNTIASINGGTAHCGHSVIPVFCVLLLHGAPKIFWFPILEKSVSSFSFQTSQILWAKKINFQKNRFPDSEIYLCF